MCPMADAQPSAHPPALPAHLPPSAASESCLLAALWTLEGLDSCRRSSATACLSSYLHLLAAFSPEVGGWVIGWALAAALPPADPALPPADAALPLLMRLCHRLLLMVTPTPPLLWVAPPRHRLTLIPLPPLAFLLFLQLVRRLTKDWPSSFRSLRRGLVAAQVDLLKQLDWRVLLPFDAGALVGLLVGCQ